MSFYCLYLFWCFFHSSACSLSDGFFNSKLPYRSVNEMFCRDSGYARRKQQSKPPHNLLNQESTPSNSFYIKKNEIGQGHTDHVSTSVRPLHLLRTKATFALLLVPFISSLYHRWVWWWFNLAYVANITCRIQPGPSHTNHQHLFHKDKQLNRRGQCKSSGRRERPSRQQLLLVCIYASPSLLSLTKIHQAC